MAELFTICHTHSPTPPRDAGTFSQTKACQDRAGGAARPINMMLIRDGSIKPIMKLFSPVGQDGSYEQTSHKRTWERRLSR